jgi:hypothetical protein
MRAAASIGAALVAVGLTCAAHAGPPPKSETKDFGLALGPFLPVGALSDGYDFGVYATFRGYYFPAASRHGVRAALWAAGADGNEGIDNGYAYGAEMNYAAHFGAGEAPFYFFVGAGLSGSDFIAISGGFPGGTQIHIRGSAFSGNIGVGYVWKRVFLEASYVEVFDDQKHYGFAPLVLGLRF